MADDIDLFGEAIAAPVRKSVPETLYQDLISHNDGSSDVKKPVVAPKPAAAPAVPAAKKKVDSVPVATPPTVQPFNGSATVKKTATCSVVVSGFNWWTTDEVRHFIPHACLHTGYSGGHESCGRR